MLNLIPLRWWIYLGVALAAMAALVGVHVHLQKKALAKQAQHYEIVLREQRDLYQKQMQDAHDVAQAKLGKMDADWKTVWDEHEKHDAEAAAKSQKQAQSLKDPKEFDRYVPPDLYPDVPRGYLLRRADAAAYANGTAEVAGPPPQASELREPSGIPYAALWPIDVDAAGAYRACRARVDEWERWGADVDRWRGDVQAALAARP